MYCQGWSKTHLFLVASFTFLGFARKQNWKLFLNYKYQVGGQLGTIKYNWSFIPDCYLSRYRQPCWTYSRILIIHNQRTIWRYFTSLSFGWNRLIDDDFLVRNILSPVRLLLTEQNSKCNARDQTSSVVLRKWFCVKYLCHYIIDNHSRDLPASNCARVSIKTGRATRSKRQFLKLSKNQW